MSSNAAQALSSGSQKGGPRTYAALASEYASIRHTSHCPLGIYVLPSTGSLLVWEGVFFVHQGYYSSLILRFNIKLDGYPGKPPVVQFNTDPFHPLVSPKDGIFSLRPRFAPWQPKEHHVFDVLHWMKAAFKKQVLDDLKEEDCLNKEAHRYLDSTPSFAALATQTALLSQSPSALYDADHPSIGETTGGRLIFRELGDDELQKMREKLGVKAW